MEYDGQGSGWMALWMVLSFVAVLVVAAVLTTALLRLRDRPEGPQPPSDARRVLDERLARGELDIEDYQARRRALADAGR